MLTNAEVFVGNQDQDNRQNRHEGHEKQMAIAQGQGRAFVTMREAGSSRAMGTVQQYVKPPPTPYEMRLMSEDLDRFTRPGIATYARERLDRWRDWNVRLTMYWEKSMKTSM